MNVIYQNLPPVATGVGCMGNHYVGQTMHGYYTYEDAEEDKEGTSTFQWYKSKNGASPIPIEGATKIDYTIAEEDVGYQLLLEVTPVNRQGTGRPSQSSLTKEILKNEPPQALRLYIEGAAYTQNTLIARYDYSDANEDKESGSTIQWYRAVGLEEEAVPIEGAVSKTYEITEEDIGCYLTFSVTPRSQGEENNEGKTQRCAEAVGPVQGLDYAQSSITQEGEAFHGAYTYVGYDQEEKAVQTGWYIGTTLSGAMTRISGAEQDTYTPRPEDEGYYLAFGTQVEGGRKC